MLTASWRGAKGRRLAAFIATMRASAKLRELASVLALRALTLVLVSTHLHIIMETQGTPFRRVRLWFRRRFVDDATATTAETETRPV